MAREEFSITLWDFPCTFRYGDTHRFPCSSHEDNDHSALYAGKSTHPGSSIVYKLVTIHRKWQTSQTSHMLFHLCDVCGCNSKYVTCSLLLPVVWCVDCSSSLMQYDWIPRLYTVYSMHCRCWYDPKKFLNTVYLISNLNLWYHSENRIIDTHFSTL